jgi:acetylornithine/succinyldiaminopimelate/putrescine aminotransferase
MSPGNPGTTLGGNPLAMSAGIAVLKTIIEDGLLDNATGMGEYFLSGLRAIKKEFGELVRDVRGKGLILGIEFMSAETAKDAVGKSERRAHHSHGAEGTRILPPLIVKRTRSPALNNRRSLKEVTVA